MCIERIQTSQQICPCCRSDEFIKILDKRTCGMELYGLKVRCENEDCDWIGELGELHRHLSNKCQYYTERCKYECGDYYHRYALPVHEQDECPNRPLEVKIESNQRKVMEKFTALEFMYQGEVESLKVIMKKQEERHKMEKQEMYRNMEKQKEQYEVEKKELQEKHEKDRKSISHQLLLNRVEIETLQKKTETDKTELVRYVNEQDEKHETTKREFVQKLEKQTNLEIELLQRRTESDKKEIMECVHGQQVKLETHHKEFELDIQEHRDIQDMKCEANKSELLQKLQNQMEEHQKERKALKEKVAKDKREFQQYTQDIQHQIEKHNERFKREIEKYENEKKELHHKLSEEGKRQDELQQQLKAKEEEYQAQLEVLKKQESDEISKLKHELSGNSYVLTYYL